jgi:hypothetical protein
MDHHPQTLPPFLFFLAFLAVAGMLAAGSSAADTPCGIAGPSKVDEEARRLALHAQTAVDAPGALTVLEMKSAAISFSATYLIDFVSRRPNPQHCTP